MTPNLRAQLLSLKKITQDAIPDEWSNRELYEALGAGPCPGDPDTDQDLEDPDDPESGLRYEPGVHDFDGGECWRCQGTMPGWRPRPPTLRLDAEKLLELVDALLGVV